MADPNNLNKQMVDVANAAEKLANALEKIKNNKEVNVNLTLETGGATAALNNLRKNLENAAKSFTNLEISKEASGDMQILARLVSNIVRLNKSNVALKKQEIKHQETLNEEARRELNGLKELNRHEESGLRLKNQEINAQAKLQNAETRAAAEARKERESERKHEERMAAAEAKRQAAIKQRTTSITALGEHQQLIEDRINGKLEKGNSLKRTEVSLETAMYKLLQQQDSLAKGRHVTTSATINAVKTVLDAQRDYNTEIAKSKINYDAVRRTIERSQKSIAQMGTNLQRVSSMISSINSAFNRIRAIGLVLGYSLVSSARQFYSYISQAASTLGSSVYEQESKLQTARIGFTNFYGEETADTLINQIRDIASVAPGIDSGDLADYVRQLASVSEGDSQLALNATLGTLKTILYGGGDASTEMEYIIKNIRDVISKGTATTIDIRQFNRAMPILEQALKAVGATDYLDESGNLNITKNNASQILRAFAMLNTDENSPVANIYEQYAGTLTGAREALEETVTTRINEVLEETGVWDKFIQVLTDLRDEGVIDDFAEWLGGVATKAMDFINNVDWDEVGETINDVAMTIADGFKSAYAAIRSSLGEVDLQGVIKRLSKYISEFIAGFGDGVAMFIDFLTWIEDELGEGTIEQALRTIGMFISPIGQVISTALGMAQNITNFFSRFYGIMSGIGNFSTWLNNKSLQLAERSVAQAAGNQQLLSILNANAGAHIANLSSTGVVGSANSSAAASAASMLGAYTGAHNLSSGGFTITDKTGSGLITGAATQNWFKSYTSAAKSAVVPTMSKVLSKAAAGLSKAISALSIFSIGTAISEAAGLLVDSVDGTSSLNEVVKGIGETATAAIALGMQFGPAGAAVGVFAGAVKTAINVINAEIDRIENEREEESNENRSEFTQQTVDSMKAALGSITGSDGAPLYSAYDEADEAAMEAATEALEKAMEKTSDPEQLREIFLASYRQTRSAYMAGEAYNAYTSTDSAEAIRTSGAYTPITDENVNNYYSQLKQLYDNLVASGILPGDQQVQSAKEIWDYLANNGTQTIEITSAEWLTELVNASAKGLDAFNSAASSLDSWKTQILLTGPDGTVYKDADELALNLGWQISKAWEANDPRLEVKVVYTMDEEGDIADSKSSLDSVKSTFIQNSGFSGFMNEGLQWSWISSFINRDQILNYLEERGITEDDAKRAWQTYQNLTDEEKRGYDLDAGDSGFMELLKKLAAASGWATGGLIPKPKPNSFFAGGGFARGVDTVPAMLQPGEFVMRKSAVDNLGVGFLNALNTGGIGTAVTNLGSRVGDNIRNILSPSRHSATNSVSYVVNNYNNRMSVANRNASGAVSSYRNIANRMVFGR